MQRSRRERRRAARKRWWLALLLVVCLLLGFAGSLWPNLFLSAVLRLDHLRTGTALSELSVDGQLWSLARRGEVQPGQPVWVFVHGLTGSKENWLPLLRQLPSDAAIVAPDLPGWGESARLPGGDYGYAAQAERLAALLVALDLRDVVLVGHSMGGGIAAVTAARHPERLRGLVLMSASGTPFKPNDFGRAVLRGEHPFAVRTRAELDAYLGLVFIDPPFLPWPLPQALLQRRQADFEFERGVLESIGRGPQAFLPEQLAGEIARPTLPVWSSRAACCWMAAPTCR
jgi:pimeloyl-ACP methyl ester carboxylesterase